MLQLFQYSFPLSHNLELVCRAVHNRGCFESAVAAINYNIYRILILLVDQFGVGGVFDHVVIVVDGHGEDRVSQFFYEGADDVIVGHTDADFFSVLVDLRQFAAGGKDEGERAGQMLFHQFECGIAHFGIFAQVGKVVADDG